MLKLQNNVMCRKACFTQKMFTSTGLPIRAEEEKTVCGIEIHLLSGKENVQGTGVSKGHPKSFLGHERPIIIDFLEKGATLNSASFCQLLRQYLILSIEYIYNIYPTFNQARFDTRSLFSRVPCMTRDTGVAVSKNTRSPQLPPFLSASGAIWWTQPSQEGTTCEEHPLSQGGRHDNTHLAWTPGETPKIQVNFLLVWRMFILMDMLSQQYILHRFSYGTLTLLKNFQKIFLWFFSKNLWKLSKKSFFFFFFQQNFFS